MDETCRPGDEGNKSGMHRRTFLGSLGAAGALAAMLPRGVRAAVASSTLAADATASSAGPDSFVVLGDFGSGDVTDGVLGTTPNLNAQAVANGIQRRLPSSSGGYIFSVGDQVYVPYDGNGETNPALSVLPYDQAVGQFYAAYIRFPAGTTSRYRDQGAAQMNFYAMLGDHDWWHQPSETNPNAGALYYPLDKATYPASVEAGQTVYLPGEITDTGASFSGYAHYFSNQGGTSSSGSNRYYDFVRGTIHWFVLSSDANETMLDARGTPNPPYTLSNAYYLPFNGTLPSGLTYGQDNLVNSRQGRWFQDTVAASASPWKFVGTHYPPFSSSQSDDQGIHYGGHPSASYMQWGYENFGIDAVFSGHVHGYERLYVNGVTYVVAGAGGTFEEMAQYPTVLPESQIIVGQQYGFLSARELPGAIFFTYHIVSTEELPASGSLVGDQFVLVKGATLTDSHLHDQKMIHITAGGGTFRLNSAVTIRDALAGVGTLKVTGKGSLRLTGVNANFTGALIVEHSNLRLSAASTLSAGVQLTLRSGVLDIRMRSQTFARPLVVAGHSKIVASPKTRLKFAGSRRAPWTRGAVLFIDGDLAPDSIQFGADQGGLSKRQLRQIRFLTQPGAVAALDAEGFLLAR